MEVAVLDALSEDERKIATFALKYLLAQLDMKRGNTVHGEVTITLVYKEQLKEVRVNDMNSYRKQDLPVPSAI